MQYPAYIPVLLSYWPPYSKAYLIFCVHLSSCHLFFIYLISPFLNFWASNYLSTMAAPFIDLCCQLCTPSASFDVLHTLFLKLVLFQICHPLCAEVQYVLLSIHVSTKAVSTYIFIAFLLSPSDLVWPYTTTLFTITLLSSIAWSLHVYYGDYTYPYLSSNHPCSS